MHTPSAALLFIGELSSCRRTEGNAHTPPPAWTQRGGRRLARLRAGLPVFEAEFFELRAQAVDVQAKLAFCEPGPHGVFFLDARFRRGGDGGGLLPLDDADTVVVGNDHVAGMDVQAGAHDRNVYGDERGLRRALRAERGA